MVYQGYKTISELKPCTSRPPRYMVYKIYKTTVQYQQTTQIYGLLDIQDFSPVLAYHLDIWFIRYTRLQSSTSRPPRYMVYQRYQTTVQSSRPLVQKLFVKKLISRNTPRTYKFCFVKLDTIEGDGIQELTVYTPKKGYEIQNISCIGFKVNILTKVT